MFRRLKLFISVFACKIVNTMQVYDMIYYDFIFYQCGRFDVFRFYLQLMQLLKKSSSLFCYLCIQERLLFKRLIYTYLEKHFEVSLLFVLLFRR